MHVYEFLYSPDFVKIKRKFRDICLQGFVRFTLPLFVLCLSQVPLVAVDSYFYGKLVIAPLNILLYNVFTPHGPDLYGSTAFYIIAHISDLSFMI